MVVVHFKSVSYVGMPVGFGLALDGHGDPMVEGVSDKLAFAMRSSTGTRD